MIKSILFRIKNEYINEWKDWCYKLQNDLRKDSVETLIEENVLQEMAMIFKINDQYYCIGFMESNGEIKSANQDKEINKQHKLIREKCLERVSDVEIGYLIKSSE